MNTVQNPEELPLASGPSTASLSKFHRSSFSRNKQSLPSDSWRSTIPASLLKDGQYSFKTNICHVSDKAKYTNALAVCPGSPFVLIGSGTASTNLYVYEYLGNQSSNVNTSSVTESNGREVPSNQSFKIKSAFSAPDPIKHMSISNSILITAGLNGCVQVFDLDASLLSEKGKGLNHLSECQFGSNSSEDIPISPPGSWLARHRVAHVDLQPTLGNALPSSFVAVQRKSIFVWDLEESKVEAVTELVADTLTVANWSPHQPFIATGSSEGTLSILDKRQIAMNQDSKKDGGVVLKINQAHMNSSITNVSFNPFVPYWLASSGQDGIVKVWDMRYAKDPAVWVDAHYDSINSFTWSNTHCDRLTTASSDHNVRSWIISSSINVPRQSSRPKDYMIDSLLPVNDSREVSIGAKLVAQYVNPTEECINATITSPWISVTTSPINVDRYFALSSCGDLASMVVHENALEKVTVHKYDIAENPEEYQIETCIYQRQLAKAYSLVTQYLRKAKLQGSSTETELTTLCQAKPKILTDSWQLASAADILLKSQSGSLQLLDTKMEISRKLANDREMVERMEKDLESFGYGLPPRFSDMVYWYKSIPATLRVQFESIGLRHQIIADIESKNHERIWNSQKVFVTCLEANPQFLEIDYFIQMFSVLLKNDFIKALDWLITILSIVGRNKEAKFSDFLPLPYMFLYPTCYDTVDNVISSSSKFMISTDYKMQNKLRLRAIDDFINNTTLWERTQIRNIMIKNSQKSSDEEKRQKEKIDILSDADTCIPFLKLELELQSLLQGSNHDGVTENEDLYKIYSNTVKIMEQRTSPKISSDRGIKTTAFIQMGSRVDIRVRDRSISSYAITMYLDALTYLQRYEELFSILMELCGVYESTMFPDMLVKRLVNKLYSDYETTLDEKIESLASFIKDATNLTFLKKASEHLVSLCLTFIKTVGCFLVAIDNKELLKTSNSESITKLLKRAGPLLEQLSEITFKTLDVIKANQEALLKSTVDGLRDQIAENMKPMNNTAVAKEFKTNTGNLTRSVQLSNTTAQQQTISASVYFDIKLFYDKISRLAYDS